MEILKKRFFYLDSSNVISSDGRSVFSCEVQLDQNYDRIVLVQANIPQSYYMIQSGFNTFILDEGGSSVTITVPEGNYNINSFSLVVKALLNTSSPNGYTYNISYPDAYLTTQTGKYTFTCSNTVANVSIQTNAYDINEQLGFAKNTTNTFSSGSLVSQNVCKFIIEDVVVIHCSHVDENNDILESIYGNNTTQFSNLTYQCPDPLAYSKRLNQSLGNTLSFSITNEGKVPLNFNGLNLTFTVLVYKDSDFRRKTELIYRAMMDKFYWEPTQPTQPSQPSQIDRIN